MPLAGPRGRCASTFLHDPARRVGFDFVAAHAPRSHHVIEASEERYHLLPADAFLAAAGPPLTA